MFILYIIAFIFAIGIIILVHEAGHFFCAKKAGILCYEFSIGMGPVLWQKKKGETMISIRLIPIGGYVSMADSTIEQLAIEKEDRIGINLDSGCVKELYLNPTNDNDAVGVVKEIELQGSHGEPLEVTLDIDGTLVTYPILKDAFMVVSPKQKIQITPYNRSFDSKKISSRMITISAGVIMNFLLAIVIYLIIYFIQGVPNYDSNQIGNVGEGYPSAFVLQEGDKITKIDDNEIASWTSLASVMDEYASKGITNLTLTYERDGNVYTENLDIYIALNNFGLSNIGIPSDVEIHKDKDGNGVQVGSVALKYGKSSSEKQEPRPNEATLTSGDTVTHIKVADGNFEAVKSWEDIVRVLGGLTDVSYINFRFYDHETSTMTVSSTPAYSYSDALLDSQNIIKIKTYIGINPTYHFSFTGCVSAAFKEFASSSMLIFNTLKELVVPSASVREVGLSDLSGVVGIFDMVSQTVSAGVLSYLSFIALLSVNIAIMNFLPIPALDGGRFVFLIYEGITHKKPNKKFETMLNNIVFFLLIALFIFVTYNDILRLFA